MKIASSIRLNNLEYESDVSFVEKCRITDLLLALLKRRVSLMERGETQYRSWREGTSLLCFLAVYNEVTSGTDSSFAWLTCNRAETGSSVSERK